MKHAWLSFVLICAAIVIIAVGLYRESRNSLSHALNDFRAALPPGAEVSYREANPNILARGVTLHDVTFHYQDIRFHARSIRLGSPQSLPGGKLSLSSLVFKEPSYATSKVQLHMARLVFRHLLIPSSNTHLNNIDLTAASMQSLAQLTQFRPDDLTSLRFEWVHAEALHLTILPTAKASYGLLYHGMGLHQIDADKLALEGYSLGGNVGASATHLRINFSLNPTILAKVSPIVLPEAFFPIAHSPATLDYSLTLEELNAREGVTHLLGHPFKTDGKNAALFWKDPLNTLWNATGTITLSHLVMSHISGTNQHHASNESHDHDVKAPSVTQHPVVKAEAKLDNLIITRRDEGAPGSSTAFTTALNTEALFQGFHLRLKDKPLSYPLSGAGTILRLSERSHKDAGQWDSDISGQLTIPSIGLVKIMSRANLPNELGDNILAQVTLNSTVLSFQGDGFVPLLMALLPKQPAPPKASIPAISASKIVDKPSDKPSDTNKAGSNKTGKEDMTAEKHDERPAEKEQSSGQISGENGQDDYFVAQRNAVIEQLNTLTIARPVLAPLSDYILKPKDRTLNITFGHFSLKTLENIPLSGPMNALFDSLHITAVTVQ